MYVIKEYLIQEYKQEHPTMNEAEVVKVMRLQNFSFYSARHSWATIAHNDLRIDKWTVHEGLNHVDNATKITDVYIKRDFTRINEANFKVIEYVLAGVWENLPK
jgi:integrase